MNEPDEIVQLISLIEENDIHNLLKKYELINKNIHNSQITDLLTEAFKHLSEENLYIFIDKFPFIIQQSDKRSWVHYQWNSLRTFEKIVELNKTFVADLDISGAIERVILEITPTDIIPFVEKLDSYKKDINIPGIIGNVLTLKRTGTPDFEKCIITLLEKYGYGNNNDKSLILQNAAASNYIHIFELVYPEYDEPNIITQTQVSRIKKMRLRSQRRKYLRERLFEKKEPVSSSSKEEIQMPKEEYLFSIAENNNSYHIMKYLKPNKFSLHNDIFGIRDKSIYDNAQNGTPSNSKIYSGIFKFEHLKFPTPDEQSRNGIQKKYYFNPSIAKYKDDYIYLTRFGRRYVNYIVGPSDCKNTNFTKCDKGDFIGYNTNSTIYITENTEPVNDIQNSPHYEPDYRLSNYRDNIYSFNGRGDGKQRGLMRNIRESREEYTVSSLSRSDANRQIVDIETYNNYIISILVIDWFRKVNDSNKIITPYSNNTADYKWSINFIKQYFNKKRKELHKDIFFIKTNVKYDFASGESDLSGIVPMFSFSTPHINIMYKGKPAKLGVGHIKIQQDTEIHPYKKGSNIRNFRKNLHEMMQAHFNKEKCRYKKYWRTPRKDNSCAGYVYMMYFYILHNRNGTTGTYNDFIMSDAFLPVPLSDRIVYGELDYKFDLIFPSGLALAENPSNIYVSAGYGDYYPIRLKFDIETITRLCRHDFKTINMEKYQYWILSDYNDKQYISRTLDNILKVIDLPLAASSSQT